MHARRACSLTRTAACWARGHWCCRRRRPAAAGQRRPTAAQCRARRPTLTCAAARCRSAAAVRTRGTTTACFVQPSARGCRANRCARACAACALMRMLIHAITPALNQLAAVPTAWLVVHTMQGVVCRPGLTFRRVMLNNHAPQALAFRDLILRGERRQQPPARCLWLLRPRCAAHAARIQCMPSRFTSLPPFCCCSVCCPGCHPAATHLQTWRQTARPSAASPSTMRTATYSLLLSAARTGCTGTSRTASIPRGTAACCLLRCITGASSALHASSAPH